MQSFYRADVVLVKETQERAMVLRTYLEQVESGDDELHPHPYIPHLQPGDLALSVLLAKDSIKFGTKRVINQSAVELEDRTISIGDAVKRNWSDSESGRVMGMEVMCRLSHVLTGEPVDGWVPNSALIGGMEVEVGDRVAYDDWIGVIEKVNEEAIVECGLSGHFYQLQDMGGRLDVGCSTDHIFCKGFPPPVIPSLVGDPTFVQERRDLSKEVIVHVRCLSVHINWVAFSQKVPIADQEDRPMPGRFWYGNELSKLIHITSDTDHRARVGSKVRFKTTELAEASNFKPSLHRKNTIKFDIMQVIETKTRVKILWQDSIETVENAIDLIPHPYLNEHECWPGTLVMFKGDDEKKYAVVQKYNSNERTAEINIISKEDPTKNEVRLVSAMEIDPQGINFEYSLDPGDIVLISTTPNGCELPVIPRIGLWQEMLELDYIESVMASHALIASRGTPLNKTFPFSDNIDSIDWYGEVKRVNPENGMVEIELPNKKVVFEDPGRLFRLIEEGLDINGDPIDFMDDEMEMDMGIGVEGEDPPYIPQGEYDAAKQWAEDHPPGKEDLPMEVDAWASVTLDHDDSSFLLPPPADSTVALAETSPVSEPPAPQRPNTVEMPSLPDLLNHASLPADSTSSGSRSAKDDSSWMRFDMLEHAPADHHFFSKPVEKTNSSFMTRLKKEFKVLASSLPDTILVRSYGDRLDLLRCLIFGPPGTPYVDAPHIIDFYLNPSRFPFDPPLAYFHSWTAGKGRINPNLYEEGKVCLSILGTWSGSSTEIWNPNRSSLLQTLVSIQGLVLVREPYFCEPAFENLQGTPEVRLHSRQYSEKAYVLTRAFVLHALRYPVLGFEAEINRFYFTEGKLASVLEKAKLMIEAGESARVEGRSVDLDGEPDENGVGMLTMGGILPLKKSVAALQMILDQHR